MSKSRVVEIVEQNGVNFGQISNPLDLIKAQEFAHAHAEQITQDFLLQDEAEVAGCNISLTAGLTVNVSSGRIYRAGLQYESSEQALTLGPPANALARIDLIVAVLSPNTPANTEFLAFQRLRTEQELDNGLSPYPPAQFQRATERHNIATLAVKNGVSSASPQPPVLAANEVALYQITVAGNATVLQLANIVDIRKRVSNLRTHSLQIAEHSSMLALNQNQIIQALSYELLQRNFPAFGRSDSLLGILQEIANKLLVLKYRFPTIVSSDGRCPATVSQVNNIYYIDIPIGVLVEFGDKFLHVEPIFADISENAQYSNASNAPAISYQPLFENSEIETPSQNNTSADGNVIRIAAPTSAKWLYLGYDGKLFFQNTPEPSGWDRCLLLRVTPKPGSAPVLKTYRNLRNSITGYTNVFVESDTSSKRFDVNVAIPLGYFYTDCYAVRASDKVRYQIPTPNIVFDSTSEVTGVGNGDTWFVNLLCLSAL